MSKHYAITLIEGIGLEMDYLKAQYSEGLKPKEFCEWLATKYDLMELGDFSFTHTALHAGNI